jgi:hypothetical protein
MISKRLIEIMKSQGFSYNEHRVGMEEYDHTFNNRKTGEKYVLNTDFHREDKENVLILYYKGKFVSSQRGGQQLLFELFK